MTDDTRERFLREITAQVPADRIAEVHLFRPLRRGATETGVAVIAAARADTVQLSGSDAGHADVVETGRASSERSEAERERSTESAVADRTPEDADGDSPYSSDAPAPQHGDRALGDAAPEHDDAPASDATIDASDATPERHTVFTARYRLTIKGAERGKWEFDVVADADAPLVTVDTVVRGVLRRAGDAEEPERLTADGVRAALDGQSWRPTA